jgi:hypothetical protein
MVEYLDDPDLRQRIVDAADPQPASTPQSVPGTR